MNFTYNEKTGEVFTNSGYNFVHGKSMGYNKKDINMGTNLKKGQFYRIEQIKKVKAEDISKNLGLINPDMSGTEFIHVQFKMQLPNEHKNNDETQIRIDQYPEELIKEYEKLWIKSEDFENYSYVLESFYELKNDIHLNFRYCDIHDKFLVE